MDKSKKPQTEKSTETPGELLKTLRGKKHLTSQQLCAVIEEEYGFGISKSKYNQIENDDNNEKDFGYKAFYYLAKYYDISLDYLFGREEFKTTDANLLQACKTIGFNEKVVHALEFWSKFKDHHEIVEYIIKSLNYDFINDILEYLRNDHLKTLITDTLLKIYCNENNLKDIKNIRDLSMENQFIFEKIINDILNEFGINSDYLYFKLEKQFQEIISTIPINNTSFVNYNRISITDESITYKYSRLTSLHDYKAEYKATLNGEANKNIKLPKKLW